MTHFKNKKGFTLIELIISVTILSLVIPTFFVFLNKAVFKVKLNSDITDALFLTQQKLEELLDKGFSDSTLTDTLTSNNSQLNLHINKNQMQNNLSGYAASHFDHYTTTTLNGQRYYIIWNVADSSTLSSLTTIKQVVVITFWISSGKGHQLSVETFLRNNS